MTTTLDTQHEFDPGTGRHPVNTGHLVMGLVFAGLVGIWALVLGDIVEGDDVRWLLPVPWVAGGAIGLAAAAYANVRSRRTSTLPGSGWQGGGARDADAEDTDPPAPTTATTTDPFDDTEPTEEIR
ncbi:hypothetical protein [Nocardioides jensenii]|uniref:hypothetical protein n=1 Tax=Nocardioides jensenii TaxID=1843 RepID=UPI0008343AB1|nr:hypothetical protein [Nocardioides jensenii]